eukprot:TRINITY_DN6865_c0_g1_i1.p1 TRINITY_DN6865_c0_g1~~TRINITY_DN6865_c0_g1_i1.p1  ORF type:complete len:237 (+),score=50.23 TRINITY_DN6865_c0_g1_i1:37-747(+)
MVSLVVSFLEFLCPLGELSSFTAKRFSTEGLSFFHLLKAASGMFGLISPFSRHRMFSSQASGINAEYGIFLVFDEGTNASLVFHDFDRKEMIKLMDFLRKSKTKKPGDSGKIPSFTPDERKEIARTLHLTLRGSKTPEAVQQAEDSSSFGTFRIDEDYKEDELNRAKEWILAKEPEAWEENILCLEKGEISPNMPDAAFKRWKKDRPSVENLFAVKDDNSPRGQRNSRKLTTRETM